MPCEDVGSVVVFMLGGKHVALINEKSDPVSKRTWSGRMNETFCTVCMIRSELGTVSSLTVVLRDES